MEKRTKRSRRSVPKRSSRPAAEPRNGLKELADAPEGLPEPADDGEPGSQLDESVRIELVEGPRLTFRDGSTIAAGRPVYTTDQRLVRKCRNSSKFRVGGTQ